MKKKILIAMLVLGLLLLGGCMTEEQNTSINTAYFNMECINSCNTCNQLQECDDICDDSGIRISSYKHKNEVMFVSGKFVCKCY